MELSKQSRILGALAHAQIEAHETSRRFGYWEKQRSLSEVFIKIHRDAAQALEIIAIGDGPSQIKDITRAEEKLADVIIRIFDVAQGKGLHVGAAVIAKMEYNEQLSKAVRKEY